MGWNAAGVRQAHGADHGQIRRERGLAAHVCALLSSAALTLLPQHALAQSTWQGTTSDYNTNGNWDNSTAPTASGQSAIFAGTGGTTVNVSSPVSPDSWTFNSISQSYTITGSPVTFGIVTGLVDNASGQTISIANNLGGVGGVAVHDATGMLQLSGTNTYSGATIIDSGATLKAGSANAFSASSNFTVIGTLDLGGFTESIGALTGQGRVVNNASATTSTLTTTASGNTFVGNLVDGAGGVLALTVGGSGTLTLSGIDTYSGATTVNSGATVKAASSQAFSYQSDFTVNGTLDLGGFNNSVGSLSGSGIVTNNGGATATLTAGGDNASTTFSGTLQDGAHPLALTVTGTGTIILTANNSYSGLTTVNSGATLQFGNGGATGTLGSGNVVNNGTLIFHNNDYLTIANAISGSGSVTFADMGAQYFLTGNSTYTGGTTISSGAIQIGLGSTTGSISGNVTDNAALNFNRSDNITFAGNITGSGFIQISGGTVTLTGINNYSGVTNVFSTLAVSSDSAVGTGGIALLGGTIAYGASYASADNFQLTTGSFNTNGNTVTLSGVITDASGTRGQLVKTGTGTLILTGANTYTNITTISAGTLQIGNGGTGGSLSPSQLAAFAIIADNGVLAFDHSDNISNFLISGTGSVVQLGSGTLTLNGNDSYSGGTTVAAGSTLKAGSFSAFGSGPMTVAGTLDLNGFSNTVASLSGGQIGTVTNTGGSAATLTTGSGISSTFGGTLQDGASALGLAVTGTNSTLILTGSNSYSGVTTIASGATLQVGNGAASGSPGSAAISDNGALTFNRSDSITLSNIVSGSGSVIVATGALTLTGSSTYTGVTTVNPGVTLALAGSGSLANSSSIQLNSGSVFDISGTASGATIKNLFSLSTSSSVMLGSQILTITNGPANSGNGTFAGVVGGGGNVVISGGTSVFIGTNNYTGSTTIAAGAELDINNNALSIATSSNVIVNGTLSVASVGGTVKSLSGSGTVTGPLTLTNASGTFAGVISNTFTGTSLTVTGGIQTLTGANTYTGATTVASGGALLLSGNGSIASSIGVVDNGAFDISGIAASSTTIKSLTGNGPVYIGLKQLVISAASDVFNGGINQGGSVEISGGFMTLTGAISPNVTVDSGATLQLGNGGTTGLVAGTIIDNGTVIIDHGNNIFLALPTGTGTLVQAGTGRLTTTNGLGLAGPVTISAGTLALSGTGSPPVGTNSAVIDDGTFDISGITAASATIKALTGSGTVILGGKQLVIGAGAGSFTGSFSGTGALELLGGTTNFATTVANSVIVDSGATLQVGNGSTSGALTGTVTNNGSLVFDRSDGITLPVIAGTGALVQAGSGTLTITSNSSFSAVTISAGTLQIGNGGTSGSISGPVTNNGTLAFDRSDSVTLPAGITGSGVLIQAGSGTLVAAGSYGFSAVTISAGTLQIGNGGTSGSLGSGPITNNGTLVFDRSDSITIANVISGSGSLAQSGTGTLILDGTNPFTGMTTVANGTLEVGDAATPGASVAGPVNVLSGGTLSGHGTIKAAVTVAPGGSLRPGGTIGTLSVNGNLSLPVGSTFVVELSPAAADRVNVGGAVTLGGNLQLIADPGTYAAGTDFKLISAASVSGTFASFSGQVPGFTNTVQYSAAGVDLILSSPVAAPTTYLFGSYGNTPNQVAAGNALTAASPSGALYTAMGALVGSSTASVPGALGQLAGDIRPSLRSAAIEDSRTIRDALLDHMYRDGDRMTVWGVGLAGYGRLASDGNAANLHHDSAGFLAGADLPVLADVTLGVEAGYSSNSARTPASLSTASGDAGHVGAYAAWRPGDVSFDIGGDYGFGSVTINRSVAGLGLAASGSQDQDTGQVFADVGYRIALDGAALEPHATIARILATGGAFAETGSAAALSGNEKSSGMTYWLMGLRANLADMALGEDMTLAPRLDLGWQHALAGLTPSQTVSYVNAGTSFTVLGTPLAQDAAALQAGLDLKITPSAMLFVSYDGSFSSMVENHVFRGGLSWRF